jgi:uncharacterized delta-60 repeat protein
VALQADGKIVAAGTTDTLPPCDFSIDTCEDPLPNAALARYNSDGALDSSFAVNGKQTTDFGGDDEAFDVALQPGADRKIVVAGQYSGRFALVRYNADGTLDGSFAVNGQQTPGFWNFTAASGIAIQPNGKILAAGGGGDFALARDEVDGTLDNSFSGDGMQATDFGGSDQGASVLLQPDGKMVVAGTTFRASGEDFALARYEGGSGPQGTPPSNTKLPVISGAATEGQTVAVTTGMWSGDALTSDTVRWRRCDTTGANCLDIAGASATTYTITAADIDHTIRVQETASNDWGTASADSAATAAVQPTPGTIAAQVTNTKKTRIGGATVNCGTAGTATTDRTGAYSMPTVRPGTYNCTASGTGYIAGSQSVTVSSGSQVTLNFSLARR